ncbi:peptidase [Paenibacillus sp. FA6]|uniref:peptidase n=1 Tax=Paenibacillus sp. FA6 TaxID=3413029 RepID=UPI003F656BB3
MTNKNMFKVLTTATILAMAVMPLAVSAQDTTSVSNKDGQALIQKQERIVLGTMGQITNLVNDKTGKFITVTGRGLATTDQSEIVLSITKDTKIVDSKGKRVPLKTIMDEKKVIKAFYGPMLTKSIPARGTALTLVVQDQSFTAINGTVSELTDTGIVVHGKDIYSAFEDTVVLHFADKTQILDQNGKVIKASEIQKGMSVKAFYGPAVTMSLPPQSTTNYVVVNTTMEESVQETNPGTDGIITNVADNKFTVIGSPMEQGGIDYVILTADEKTEIVDEDGKSLTLDALKADVRVDAYYGPVMTMIFPAQTHADKIVVKATETNKVEGTIVASDDLTEGQVYVKMGSSQSPYKDVILNITKDTKVISMFGGAAELKAGMKVTAYHSPMMTKSLPGITNAEIVVITHDESIVAPK